MTWPSTRQGVTSTLLTILPGQEAGGVSAVWPRVTTLSGAESASPGRGDVERRGSRQTASGEAAARRGRAAVLLGEWHHSMATPRSAGQLRAILPTARRQMRTRRGALARSRHPAESDPTTLRSPPDARGDGIDAEMRPRRGRAGAATELARRRARRASASPTPSRAPAATRGSGTGTPASRRSSGAASSRARARRELESLLGAQRPDGFVGHTIFWRGRSRSPACLLQRRQPRRAADRDDPAAAPRLGLADRRRRPGRGAADRRPARLAGRQPRPRGRRPALDRPARRVGARRLAQVRAGLGPARQRPPRLPAAGPPQPQARLGRAADPRPRRPGPLRDARQHALVALAAGARPALGDAGPGRPPLGRAPRPLRRRSPAGGAAARSR